MLGKKDEELQIGKQEKNNKKKERVRNREIVIVTCFFPSGPSVIGSSRLWSFTPKCLRPVACAATVTVTVYATLAEPSSEVTW